MSQLSMPLYSSPTTEQGSLSPAGSSMIGSHLVALQQFSPSLAYQMHLSPGGQSGCQGSHPTTEVSPVLVGGVSVLDDSLAVASLAGGTRPLPQAVAVRARAARRGIVGHGSGRGILSWARSRDRPGCWCIGGAAGFGPV